MAIPSRRPPSTLLLLPLLSLLSISLLALTTVGCGSSSTPANFDSGVGGPVTGDLDNHCSAVEPIVTSAASCHPPADAGVTPGGDGGADDGGADPIEPPDPIRFNAESDDDDCKYHVKFQMTAARQNQNVTFKVTVTKLADGQPATGAGVDIESFLESNDTHPIPNNGIATSESSAPGGVYTIAPVKFDVADRWVVRFHIFEQCADLLEDSPHGHVTFLVNVVP